MSNFRIFIFLSLLALGCSSRKIWDQFTLIEPLSNPPLVKPHAFQKGVYALSVKVSSDRLSEFYDDSFVELADHVNENHIASCIWFMDDFRFVQVSRFRDRDSSPFPFLDMRKSKSGDIFHLGRYEMVGNNEIILNYLEPADTTLFSIQATFAQDYISFQKFENKDLDSSLPNIENLQTLFEEPQDYHFFPLDTKVLLSPTMYLDSIITEKQSYKYIIVQESRDKRGKRVERKIRQKQKGG